MTEPDINGLDSIAVKTEPEDPLLESEPPVIPKEYTVNGIHDDSDCEDISHFTQVEVDNTRKCLENTRLIIKDFETQLDWHLQQYMTLRNIFDPKKPDSGKNDTSKRQDLLSISQLSAIIANHPEGNKKFIKRKGPMSNGVGGRKRRRNKDSDSEEESDFSDEDSDEEEDYEDEYTEDDSEDIDDPGKNAKRGRGKRGRASPEVKDEIVEEEHELIEPKQEIPSEDEMMEEDEEEEEEEEPPTPPPKKTPAKRGRKPAGEAKTPAKRGRGKKNQGETVDLTNLKKCKVVLNRVDEGKDSAVEIKDEDIDRDELIELLQSKAVTELESLDIDSEKPIAILKTDNVKTFDFNECKTSNVIVTFEDFDDFPEFIFVKQVADHILEDSIKLVDANVFDQHLSDEK